MYSLLEIEAIRAIALRAHQQGFDGPQIDIFFFFKVNHWRIHDLRTAALCPYPMLSECFAPCNADGWNPDSKFHCQRLRNPIPVFRNLQHGIQNPRLSSMTLHEAKCLYIFGTHKIWYVFHMFVEMQMGQMFFKRLWNSFYLQFWTNLAGHICRATKATQTALAKTATPLETDVKRNLPPLWNISDVEVRKMITGTFTFFV